jgi:hypothetical protein
MGKINDMVAPYKLTFLDEAASINVIFRVASASDIHVD